MGDAEVQSEQNRLFEIGHFALDDQSLLKDRVWYIVCELVKDIHYVLHADAKRYSHNGVCDAADDACREKRGPILGGGTLTVQRKELGYSVSLEGHSSSFGKEPDDIRAAFVPLVTAKLKEIGMKMV